MLFKNRVHWRWASRILPPLILLALSVTLMVGLVGAEVADGRPPAPSVQAVSPLVPYAPTTEELLAAPPSIERYVAAHTLPLSVRSATGLDKAELALMSFIPLTTFGFAPLPGQPTLTAGTPTSSHAWTLSWTADPAATVTSCRRPTVPTLVTRGPLT